MRAAIERVVTSDSHRKLLSERPRSVEIFLGPLRAETLDLYMKLV
jgi:hypothetical protein